MYLCSLYRSNEAFSLFHCQPSKQWVPSSMMHIWFYLKNKCKASKHVAPFFPILNAVASLKVLFPLYPSQSWGKEKKTYVDCDMLFVFSCCCSAGTFSAVAVDERCESERLRLKSGELKLEPKIIQFSMPPIYLSIYAILCKHLVCIDVFWDSTSLFRE